MLIGLTGGIGSGKSTALNFFNGLGFKTLDADSVCHGLYQDKSCKAYQQMVNRWGDEIITKDGSICRKAVADIIFKDQNERNWLNNILHPKVLEYALIEYRNDKKLTPMLFDVPLLFEVGWRKYFNKTIVVYVTPEIQVKRLTGRGLDEVEIKRRIKAQMPLEKKLEMADYGLINNGTREILSLQCQKLFSLFQQDFKKNK